MAGNLTAVTGLSLLIGQHETMRVSNKPHDRLRLSATNRARP